MSPQMIDGPAPSPCRLIVSDAEEPLKGAAEPRPDGAPLTEPSPSLKKLSRKQGEGVLCLSARWGHFYSAELGDISIGLRHSLSEECCSPIKMSPFAPNRNVPSGSGSWSAPSPCKLMMATPRDPSRVREAKPYGPALDCSLAVAKTALCSTRRRGSRAYGKRGHLYWATEGDISIGLRHSLSEEMTD